MKIINLLPPQEQDLLRKQKVFYSLKAATAVSFLSYLVIVGILFGWRMYLASSLTSLDNQIVEQNRIISGQDNTELKKEADRYNFIAGDYKKFMAEMPEWSRVLAEFAALVPGDVQITSLNGNTVSGKIAISGKSRTRDSVLTLRSRIASSSYFKNIDLPLENLQKPTNVEFRYTFYLKDNVLIKNHK